MLLSLLEDTDRNTAVGVAQPTLPVEFIVLEEAIVLFAVLECKYSSSTHPVVLPSALVGFNPLPVVQSLPVDLVTAKLSAVIAAVIEVEFTVSVFVAIQPLPFVVLPLSPLFDTESFLPIVVPFS